MSSAARPTWFLALLALVVASAGCDEVRDPLDFTLDPKSNAVSKSPAPFAPREGGLGQGLYEDSLPLTTLVLTESKLRDAGETNCGQFSAEPNDLELTLYGKLAPGAYSLGVPVGAIPQAGQAELKFGGASWTSGTVTVSEGATVRGSRVRGRIEAKGTSTTGDPTIELALTFDAVFSGCGTD